MFLQPIKNGGSSKFKGELISGSTVFCYLYASNSVVLTSINLNSGENLNIICKNISPTTSSTLTIEFGNFA